MKDKQVYGRKQHSGAIILGSSEKQNDFFLL